MSTTMNVPVGQVDSKKNDVAPLPSGYQLATLYGIVMAGSFETDFGTKPRAYMLYEFPLQRNVFYEGEPEKPYVLTDFIYNYSFFKTAGFRKKIEDAIAKKMTESEAKNFNIVELVGKNYVTKIVHNAKDDNIYANIDSIGPLDDQMRTLFGLQPGQNVPQENDTVIFAVGTKEDNYNFLSEDFKALPNWLKDKVKESNEGKAFIASGGTFPENNNNTNGNGNTSNVPSQKVIMIDKEFTYEEYINAGHTDETLVAEGKAKWMPKADPVQAKAPSGPSSPASPSSPSKPVAPSAPAQPQSSAQAPAQIPSVPKPNIPSPTKTVETKTYFKFHDESMQPHYDAFIAEGWTDEMLEAANHGKVVTE